MDDEKRKRLWETHRAKPVHSVDEAFDLVALFREEWERLAFTGRVEAAGLILGLKTGVRFDHLESHSELLQALRTRGLEEERSSQLLEAYRLSNTLARVMLTPAHLRSQDWPDVDDLRDRIKDAYTKGRPVWNMRELERLTLTPWGEESEEV